MTGSTPPSVCAVIPAAGLGSRLGLPGPKLLVEVADGLTIWDVLAARLSPVTEHRHLVVSPQALATVRARVSPDTTVSVQSSPRGMGDAVFSAARVWSAYDAILIAWGDQAHVAADTVRRVADGLRTPGPSRVVLPLVRVEEPYVQYDFDGPTLTRVRQSREGDVCDPYGLSDVGVFGLSTAGLEAAWWDYLTDPDLGAGTGELNLLPFLLFLSQRRGWPVHVVPVHDPDEARGVNTPEDLAYTRRVAASWTR